MRFKGNMRGQTACHTRRRLSIFAFFMIGIVLPAAVLPGCAASRDRAGDTFDTPIITEVMSSNTCTITNEDGQYCDWIELYNPSDHPIDLAGYTITDNPPDAGQIYAASLGTGAGGVCPYFCRRSTVY